MFIGNLRDFAVDVYNINRQTRPVMQNSNDSSFFIAWNDLGVSGVDLHVKTEREHYISNVVLSLGETSDLNSIKLYTKDKSKLLYEYHGETGKTITEKEIALSAERYLNEFIIEITADLSDIDVKNIDLYGADFEGAHIYPTPQKFTGAEGYIDIIPFDTVSADCNEASIAVSVLKEKLYEETGVILKDAIQGSIRFECDKAVKPNGYRLTVAKDSVTICANDGRGFVQAVESFVKLIEDNKAPCCDVEDKPLCTFRGVHLMLPAEDQMDFTKRLIKYLLSPMGYNHIILEIAGALQFDSHPEINEAFEEAVDKMRKGAGPYFPHSHVGNGKTVSKESLRDLVAYARSFGIEVIPEIQSLSHVEFLTNAHPEIAERAPEDTGKAMDTRFGDVPSSEFYPSCYCPSNPKSYEILFDVADEIIETVQPKEFVHMGHDEVYQLGVCPKCKDKSAAQLFADDVTKIHDYLASKGLKMMIWSDMLQSYSQENVGKYRAWEAIDQIPKDILLLDFVWYFFPQADIEDTLLPHGFDIAIGNLYSSHFPRYETRIRKEKIIGGEVSTWVATQEAALAREGKFYDFLYTAEMLWSERYSKHLRYLYDKVISGIIPKLRGQIRNRNYPSLSKNPQKTIIGLGAVNGRFDSILFEHTASEYIRRIPWRVLPVIANYTVNYANGTVETIPVTYGGNIGWRYRRHNEPFAAMYYRHNGYTSTWETDGKETEDGTFYVLEWINPKPDIPIKSIELTPIENAQTQVIVGTIFGVKITSSPQG